MLFIDRMILPFAASMLYLRAKIDLTGSLKTYLRMSEEFTNGAYPQVMDPSKSIGVDAIIESLLVFKI